MSATPADDPLVRSLVACLGASVDDSRIVAEVEAARLAYSSATVRRFIPILVERRVRAHLRPRAAEAGDHEDPSGEAA